MFAKGLHFDGTNYITFWDQVLLAAQACGAHRYLKGTILEKGATIMDAAFQSIIIGLLPESWDTIVASLYATTTSVQLISGLTVHWDQVKACKPMGTLATALQATTKTQKPKLVCTNINCGRSGHTAANCYWKGEGKEGQFPANFWNRESALAAVNTTNVTSGTPAANVAIAGLGK
ncbi:hypothetical protein C0993_012341 [Termitomyces sp. T159_Od127]|nr:hypothetical protein C0993_012341 [Termitomyces sp. T159_Od127]